MYQTESGEVFIFGKNADGQVGLGNGNVNEPQLLMKDDSISILLGFFYTFFFYKPIFILFFFCHKLGGSRLGRWSHKHHVHYSEFFKRGVLAFVLVLKRVQKQYNLKIPKFVLFEILQNLTNH